jgi:putative DNA primase/helicase
MDWQRHGLGVPQEVVAATQQYQAEQDTLAAFLADTCVVAQSASVTAGRLYQAYHRWADNSGEAPLTLKGFAAQLAERGFKKIRTRDGMIYQGIGVAVVASEADNPRMFHGNGDHPLYHGEVMQ